MDIDHTNLGYETSRREQARLHEELAQREKSLRDTRIRNIHEVEELKRAQEMRIDEFSRQELSERQATIHELTSQKYKVYPPKLQISELHFDKFPTPWTFSCRKIRFKAQASACFSSPLEAMLWIKEVEMVYSVCDLKTSHSIQGYSHFPNFEMLDARIASALNKIIQNPTPKRRSVWGNRKLRKRIGSYPEDRSLA